MALLYIETNKNIKKKNINIKHESVQTEFIITTVQMSNNSSV